MHEERSRAPGRGWAARSALDPGSQSGSEGWSVARCTMLKMSPMPAGAKDSLLLSIVDTPANPCLFNIIHVAVKKYHSLSSVIVKNQCHYLVGCFCLFVCLFLVPVTEPQLGSTYCIFFRFFSFGTIGILCNYMTYKISHLYILVTIKRISCLLNLPCRLI